MGKYPGPHEQKAPYSGLKALAVTLLRCFKKFLFFFLFVNEAWWDSGKCAGNLEPGECPLPRMVLVL